MRSVVILGSAYPLRGGLSAYNERIAKAFMDQGIETTIYTFSLQYPNFLFPGKSQYAEGPAPENLNIQVKVNSVNPLNWIKVGRELSRLKPDLIIVKYWLPFMGPCFGTVLRLAKKNGHTKVLSILDNIIPHEKRPGDNMFTKYFVKPVDAFIAMSKSVLNDLEIFDRKKPRKWNPHPIYDNFGQPVTREEALQHLGLDSKFRYILFFGFIRDYKGLDLLIEAMSHDQVIPNDVRLIVSGEYYSNEEKYLDLIQKFEVQDKLVMKTDFIPDDEVRFHFCAADLIVQPYKTATQSGVTQIAYHFEKPMVVTNVGGLGEFIPDGKVGFVVSPEALDIAKSIQRFYSGNPMRFQQGVQEEKKKYSWDRMLQSIQELFNEVN